MPPPRPARTAPPGRARLAVEVLEGRAVPANFVVTTASDSGFGSLRDAISQANFAAGSDTISFAPALGGQTINVTSELDIFDISGGGGPLTITGPGGGITLDGAGIPTSPGTSILGNQSTSPVALLNLTFQNNAGGGGSGGNGGAINNAGLMTLDNVTVQNNSATSQGGGVYNLGTLTVNNSRFVNNTAPSGGAIFNAGAATTIDLSAFTGNTAANSGGAVGGSGLLTVSRSTFSTNKATGLASPPVTALGGAISASGTLTIADAAFDGNQAGVAGAPGSGGAVYATGDATVSRSTFTANSATSGAGLYLGDTTGNTYLVFNSTLSGNTASGSGGGAYLAISDGGTAQSIAFRSTTVVRNSAAVSGGGLFSAATLPSGFGLRNVVVALNTGPAGPDLAGAFDSVGGSVFGSTAGAAFVAGANALVVPDPLLGPLQANGGFTQTVAPLANSAALGAGITDTQLPTPEDQRQLGRPAAGPIDAGAFQVQRPVSVTDTYSTPFGTPLTVSAPGVLPNDSNPDPAFPALTAALVSGPAPAQGSLVLNPDGSFTFTPAAGFSGVTTFTYRAVNAAPGNVATVTITVGAGTPVALNDSYSTPFGTPLNVPPAGVLVNDSTPNAGQTLTAALVTGPAPAQGTLTLNPDGSFTFTPAAGFSGAATFTYAAADGLATSATATVTITVVPGTPVATPDGYATPFGTPLSVPVAGVLVNDSTPNAGQQLTATIATAPAAAQGTVALNPDGSFVFTPAPGFSGVATFSYTVSDGLAASAPAAVSITVGPGTPVAAPDSYATAFGTPLTVPAVGLLVNDSTPNAGRQLAAALAAAPPASQGSVVVNPDGSFTFTPEPGFVGVATFTYVVTDGLAVSAPATVSVTVGARPPLPQLALTLANETPADSNILTLSGTVNSPNGVAVALAVVGPAGPLPPVFALAAGGVYRVTFPFPLPDGAYAVTATGVDPATQATTNAATITLTVRTAAPRADARRVALGAGALLGGGPRVRTFAADGTPRLDFYAYDQGFGGGVRVATGDVNGDGVDDVVTAPGLGGGPHVKVFDGQTGALIASFFAYESTFTGGVFVAVGDVTGDGVADIVTGTSSGGGARVRVFDGAGGFAPLAGDEGDFFTYDPGFRGGVRVAVGDVNGDGVADIVTGAGISGGPRVQAFSLAGGTRTGVANFFAFDPAFRGGIFVAVAPGGRVVVTPDGTPDPAGTIAGLLFPGLPDFNGSLANRAVVNADLTAAPELRVFDAAGNQTAQASVFEPGFEGGARVSTSVAPDGTPLVYAAAGESGGSRVRTYRLTPFGLEAVGDDRRAFEDSFTGSVYVGGGLPGR